MKTLFILLFAYILLPPSASIKHHAPHSRKEGNAYIRGNLINHAPGHKPSEQDFDHIIVVKNTKTNENLPELENKPPDITPFQNEKVLSNKDAEYDHTIVVETKAMNDDAAKANGDISDKSEQALHDTAKTRAESIEVKIEQALHDKPKMGEETDQSLQDSAKSIELTISEKAREALQEAEKTVDESTSSTIDKAHQALLDAIKTTQKTTPEKTDEPLRLVSEKEEMLPTFETPVVGDNRKLLPTQPTTTIVIVQPSSDLPIVFPDTISDSRDKETITKIQSSSSKTSSGRPFLFLLWIIDITLIRKLENHINGAYGYNIQIFKFLTCGS